MQIHCIRATIPAFSLLYTYNACATVSPRIQRLYSMYYYIA